MENESSINHENGNDAKNTTNVGNEVLADVSSRLSSKKEEKTEYVKPIKTPDWWNDLYTDACGNCYSDADSGL